MTTPSVTSLDLGSSVKWREGAALQSPRAGMWERQWFGPLAVGVAAIGFGLSPYFATKAFESGISPFAASFMRVAVLMVALSPWAGHLRGWAREAATVAGAGAISMIGFTGFFVVLDRAPVAAATVVYYTYPVVVLVLASIVWRRRLLLWEATVCSIVLVGVVLAVGPIGMSSHLLTALAPAFAAPVGWAIYLLVLSGPAAAMPTLPKVFAGACGGVVALLPLTIGRTGGTLMPITTDAVTSMGLLALCTLAIPALLVTWGASRSGGKTTAMIGSFEFVVAVSVGWLFMGSQLSSTQISGVSLVLAAATYSASRGSQPTRER
ncbi:MAG: DMT family transporter [Actinomycetia bacterium]|nr:DMT family transporter [Actinomycetes bacterium]